MKTRASVIDRQSISKSGLDRTPDLSLTTLSSQPKDIRIDRWICVIGDITRRERQDQ